MGPTRSKTTTEQRKRGRPTGSGRIPLTLEERRARNAMYEKERREETAKAYGELGDAVGCGRNVTNVNIMAAALGRIERMGTEPSLNELRSENSRLLAQLRQLQAQAREQGLLEEDDSSSSDEQSSPTRYSPEDEDISPDDDDISPEDDDISPDDDDMSPEDDDISPEDEGISPGDEDINPEEEHDSPNRQGTSPGDEGISLGNRESPEAAVVSSGNLEASPENARTGPTPSVSRIEMEPAEEVVDMGDVADLMKLLNSCVPVGDMELDDILPDTAEFNIDDILSTIPPAT